MTQEEKFKKMTTADVRVLVSKLAIPTIISMLITTIYNMADTYFVGHINTNATAAVGIVFPFMAVTQACGFFFGHGSGNYISKELGQQNTKDASKMASTAFFTSLTFGFMILIVSMIYKTDLVNLLGSTDKIRPYAIDYLKYILIGVPFYSSSLTLNNQLRFQGNAVYAMVGITAGGILNIALDPILIFGFNMGIKGAAIATSASQIVSFVILYIGTTRPNNIHISFKEYTPCKLYFKEILKGGAPSLLRQSIGSVTNVAMNFSAKAFCIYAGFDKEAAIAALSIVAKVTMFIYSVIVGYGQGFQPVCGFNYGAKKFKRVKDAFFFSIQVTTVFMIVMGIIFAIFAPNIIGFFNNDISQVRSQVINIGARTLRFTCMTFPLMGFLVLSNMMMQNLGIAVRASLLSIARQGLFYIPLVMILPRLFGFTGIQMCQAVSDVFALIISIPLTISVFKRELNEKLM